MSNTPAVGSAQALLGERRLSPTDTLDLNSVLGVVISDAQEPEYEHPLFDASHAWLDSYAARKAALRGSLCGGEP
jgi:hypothetical protein